MTEGERAFEQLSVTSNRGVKLHLLSVQRNVLFARHQNSLACLPPAWQPRQTLAAESQTTMFVLPPFQGRQMNRSILTGVIYSSIQSQQETAPKMQLLPRQQQQQWCNLMMEVLLREKKPKWDIKGTLVNWCWRKTNTPAANTHTQKKSNNKIYFYLVPRRSQDRRL